jgi:hypothetical protein
MDRDALHDELTQIDGVGDARAEEILGVLDDTGLYDGHAPDPTDAREALAEALANHDVGRHSYAAKYTRRAYAALGGTTE